MGEAVMELGDRELEKIGQYVQSHLEEWGRGKVIERGPVSDPVLLERIVRVEEGLKSQLELMRQGFNQMEKRFEQIDKRFEDMQYNMDKRFEQVDKRFSQLQWTMGIGFTILAALMGVFNFF